MAAFSSISKRKNSNSHYEEDNDNIDELQPIQLCDRERSKLNKRMKINKTIDVQINICNDCGYWLIQCLS